MTTRADINAAESFCRERRLALLPLLRMDITKAPAADRDGCRKAHAAASADPMKFDAMLTHSAVVKLFACGALFFGRTA